MVWRGPAGFLRGRSASARAPVLGIRRSPASGHELRAAFAGVRLRIAGAPRTRSRGVAWRAAHAPRRADTRAPCARATARASSLGLLVAGGQLAEASSANEFGLVARVLDQLVSRVAS